MLIFLNFTYFEFAHKEIGLMWLRHFHIGINFTLLMPKFTILFTNVHGQPRWEPEHVDDLDKSFNVHIKMPHRQ